MSKPHAPLSKPSRTALTVLTGVWLTACEPSKRAYVDPPLAEYAEGALRALGSRTVGLFKSDPLRRAAWWLERRNLPGICVHYCARKRAIRRIVLKSSPKRLLVLGAGLDGLGPSLASELEVFEFDIPQTQEVKRRLLDKLGWPKPRLCPASFQGAEVRLDLPLQGRPPTVAVAEGLLMYLPAETVEALAKECRRHADTLVATFMGVGDDGLPRFPNASRRIDQMLARSGEPFLWGCRPSEIAELLAGWGWDTVAVLGHPSEPGVTPVDGMVPGEWIVHAKAKSDLM